MRICLRLNDVPELTALPWELMYDPVAARFLTRSNETPLVRYLELPQAVQELAVEPPLHVLVMLSSPQGYPKLDTEAEWSRLEEALGPLQKRRKVMLERLPDACLSTLRERLRHGPYHIFHFTGHGAFDEESEDGVLVMADDEGNGIPVRARDLGDILRDHPSLRLAVLNSCQGARSAHDDPFAGAAQDLVRAGIPAVVAMQFEIDDRAAALFGRELYSALADGYPLDGALGEARKALAEDQEAAHGATALAWATPVLFMRSADGTIWQLKNKRFALFGYLQVPGPVLAALLVVACGAILIGWLTVRNQPHGPPRMPGAFNVAVADFGAADASGRIGRSDDGDRLSQWVFDSLVTQRDGFADVEVKTDVAIWQDSLPASVKGATIGRVDNEKAAQDLADRIGAQMVIWGNLDAQKNFIPHFYISSQERGDSDLVTGHYQLGEMPILVDMGAAEAVKAAVTGRTNTLFWFTVGLRQENYGQGSKALAVLQQGEKYAARMKGKSDGQGLYYMFLGQAALMAEGDPTTLASADDQAAESALRKALAIDPGLVRAQVLLGTLYFNHAQALQGADRLESTDWEQAVSEYQKAIKLADSRGFGQFREAGAGAASCPRPRVWGPDGTPLFALGQAYKIEGDAYMQTKQYAEADRNYDTAINNIETSRPVLAAGGEERLLGQADLSLAGAYWNKAVIRRLTGRPAAEAKPLDDAARAAATECVGLDKQDQYDSVLADRVIAAGCQPLLDRLTSPPG